VRYLVGYVADGPGRSALALAGMPAGVDERVEVVLCHVLPSDIEEQRAQTVWAADRAAGGLPDDMTVEKVVASGDDLETTTEMPVLAGGEHARPVSGPPTGEPR
jgi:hypothetical protein